LLHIINQGENEILGFKTSFNKAAIETIVAFSITKGKGRKILIGVKDDKTIIGVSATEEIIQNEVTKSQKKTPLGTPSLR
jgi:predicted HTH transcriptional regulator